MVPRRIASLLAMQLALVFTLTACGSGAVRDDGSLFLEPCLPIDGSDVDPCLRDLHWTIGGSRASYSSYVIPEAPIDLFTRMKFSTSLYESGLNTPQFYVRGTFKPGSVRCLEATVITYAAEPSLDRPLTYGRPRGNGKFDYNCFIDLRVSEYLNGDGPVTIPILTYWGRASQDENSESYAYFRNGGPALGLEGKEMVVVLTRPLDIAVGAWGFDHVAGWDVQRREDGVVVVSVWTGILGPPDPSNWEYTLEEFRPLVKDAMALFRAHMGGRIGYHPDDPEFAEDANGASLIENLRGLGAFTVDDVTPAPAPTVPGETDPDPYGFSVNEDTLTASPEVPGGLEDTPTPVSALGDEPTATATDSVATSQLEVVVPPCLPFPGSDVDPCGRRDSFDTFTPGIEATVQIPDVVETITQSFLRWSDRPYWATHFVVRATVIPGSTRCGPKVPVASHLAAYESGDSNSTAQESFCYVDLSVNEYLVGQGPSRITATTGVNIQGYHYDSECGALCRAHGAEEVRATGIEGVEWILYLGGPRQLGQGAWDLDGVFDVQRRQDGTVVVVNRYKGVILERSKPENYDVNLSRLEQPLDGFRKNVTEAFAAFVALTGGRTGTVNDKEGRLPPILASNAGPAGFNDFLVRTRLSEGTPAPPPPVPGENDPNPDGLSINDIIATKVAGGVRIPGGLEDTPTPVSALGDERTATTTAPTPESEGSDE